MPGHASPPKKGARWGRGGGSYTPLPPPPPPPPAPLDTRRADEDAAERALVAGERNVGLEAPDLAAVAVATHGEVDLAEERLARNPVHGLAREQDHPGARSEDRPRERPDRVLEPVEPDEPPDRGGLAAGDDEAVEPFELLGLSHLDGVGAQPAERRDVLAEVPLDCQNADSHTGILGAARV